MLDRFQIKDYRTCKIHSIKMTVMNLLHWNSMCTTAGSRRMFYKLPINPGKHFKGCKMENSLYQMMRYLNTLGTGAIMVSVPCTKCISKHA
jgi:hypothetical protein